MSVRSGSLVKSCLNTIWPRLIQWRVLIIFVGMTPIDHKNLLAEFILQKNYPCIAAVQALHRNEIIFDQYSGFGAGEDSLKLVTKLLEFRDRQKHNQEQFLTYVAIFDDQANLSEEEFELALWRELSAVWSHPEQAGSWDTRFSDDPLDQRFCFSVGGEAFFVVGMHPQSSRISRRYPRVAIAFNLYSQFSDLMETGRYQEMVRLNRNRDIKFQGSINPMVEKYHDLYEPIQFSGRANTDDWRCPFTKGLIKGTQMILEKVGL